MIESGINIFLSYSSVDEPFCIELQKHLSPLKRVGLIKEWYDHEIMPGTEWKKEVRERLNNSNIVLSMISPDFLNSDYLYNHELKIAMELHDDGRTRIVPIMLRRCDIEHTQFQGLQGLPTNLEPVNSPKWFSADDAYADIVTGIKLMIDEVRNKKKIWKLEEEEWQKANSEDTAEAYLYYLEKSYLKIYAEKAFKKLKNIFIPRMESDTNQKLNYEFLKANKERLAAELHDSVGSLLAIVKWHLQQLEQDHDHVPTINKLISEAINETRRISHALHYDLDINHEFNLKTALIELESSLIKSEDLEIELTYGGLEKLTNPYLGINVLRIVQELLSNILKHAQASKAMINIGIEQGKVLLFVQDNGIGVPDLNMNKEKGIGWQHIKSRVDHYKGDITISSPKNGGTEIHISIPMEA